MTKITLTHIKQEDVEFDVEFPIFRETDVPWDHGSERTFTMILESKVAYHVTHTEEYGRDGSKIYELEIESRYEFDTSDPDYHLGRGKYSSSKNAFYAALKKMQEALSFVPDKEIKNNT